MRAPAPSPESRLVRRPCSRVRPLALAACSLLAVAACTSVPSPDSLYIRVSDPTESQLELYARRQYEAAQQLLGEGRIEAAARATSRGLEAQPDHARLHRLRATLLETMGESQAARDHRVRADQLDPVRPDPSEDPLDLESAGVLVVVLSPDHGVTKTERVPAGWPAGPVAAALAQRLETRFPEASIRWLDGTADVSTSVPRARRWLREQDARALLTLRLDRAFCQHTAKDGAFALAWIRFAAAAADDDTVVGVAREVIEDPEQSLVAAEACSVAAVTWALEGVLADADVRTALAAPELRPGAMGPGDLRILFPELERRIAQEISEGRRLSATGQLESALVHFRRALEVDPEDPAALTHVEHTLETLALSRQLSSTPEASDPGILDPRFSESEERALERRLRDEEQQRRELLAALEVLDQDRLAPSSDTLSVLRPVEIRDPGAVGPRLARDLTGGPVRASALFGPLGDTLARYYFAEGDPEGSSDPAIREDGHGGDGQPDHWTAYRDGRRHLVWQDRTGRGFWDLHLVFTKDGETLERVEMDSDGDGRSERVFRYAGGVAVSEERDTDGSGRIDVIDHFDPSGSLALREEDLDGDGEADILTHYRAGQVTRRQIVNPAVAARYQ